MWLSLGIAAMPNRVWQFDRPCPSASARWCPRNDGLSMKNTENAARPMSAMVYRRPAPALVLKPGTDFFQLRQQFFQRVHAAVESHYHPPGKALFMIPSQFNAPPAPSPDANATQPH